LTNSITTIGPGSLLREETGHRYEGMGRRKAVCCEDMCFAVSLGRSWLAHSELGVVSQGSSWVHGPLKGKNRWVRNEEFEVVYLWVK